MFSKYDVYTTVQSMYCYPDTDVLINKLDIRDKAELKQAEEEFTASQADGSVAGANQGTVYQNAPVSDSPLSF